MIFLTDKNLGPCVMNRYEYIDQILKQYLSNKNSYKCISKKVAREDLYESIEVFLTTLNYQVII